MGVVFKAREDRLAVGVKRARRPLLTILAIGQLFITVPVVVFSVVAIQEIIFQEAPLSKVQGIAAITSSPVYRISTKTVHESARAIKNMRFPFLRFLGYNPDFPSLSLDLKQKSYRKLEFAARHDLSPPPGGTPTLRYETKVPAVLRIDNDALRVRLRLKGDRTSQWSSPERWSFRVEVRDGQTLFGMKRFSLHKPIHRNYIYEWLFHAALRHEGLIGLRYRFVSLTVNGEPRGVYAVEEHFDKRLVENNHRREGPLLKYGEENFGSGKLVKGRSVWAQMPVIPYERTKWRELNPNMVAHAAGLLVRFRAGELPLSDVFDVQLLARFFALCDILETFHGSVPKSVRFYYNPITARLEPVGFDGHFNDKQYPVLTAELSDFRKEQGFWNYGPWYKAIFERDIENNLAFWDAYVANLERLSDPNWLNTFFDQIGAELENNLDFLYTEFPFIDLFSIHPATGLRPMFYFSRDVLENRQQFVRARLARSGGVTAWIEDASLPTIRVANGQRLPVEIRQVVSGSRIYRPRQRTVLAGKPRYAHAKERVIDMLPTGETSKLRDEVVYSLPGSDHLMRTALAFWHRTGPATAPPLSFGEVETLAKRSYLSMDRSSAIVSIKPGRWEIKHDLVVPAGYTLVAGAGTELDLRASARLIVHGQVRLSGTAEAPVVIRSRDGTGQGLVVLGKGFKSELRNVVFKNLSLGADARWALTAVVTFNESDVLLENVEFRDNASEDALNLIRSRFIMRRVTFANTQADGFDCDFCDGQIENSIFRDAGNDAIDVSGSRIIMRGVSIVGAGDKGVSIGEASTVEASGLSVTAAKIAVAVKDSSSLDAFNPVIRDSLVAFAIYQKKTEFGPASANVWRASLGRVTDPWWIEEGSSLIEDGKPVAANRKNVKDLLYPAKVGTSGGAP